MARLLGPLAEKVLGVPLPVTNIAGASGNTGLAKIGGGRADGYTISVFTGITLSAWAMGIAPYKIDDFEWIIRTQSVPSYLFVKSDNPLKSAQDFIHAAKSRELKIATAGYGTLDDLALRFMAAKGLKVVNVPFAKPGERYAAPLGGHVDAMYEEAGDVGKFLEAKQIRPLLIFAKRRNPAFPDVPTSYELGFPISFYNWRGIVAKKGTAPDQVKALSEAFMKALESQGWKSFCQREDCQADSTLGPEEFRRFVAAEFEDLSKFAKQYGLIKQ
jgi:tripartite-type tricarboxylate transporter receptor subunit TctC